MGSRSRRKGATWERDLAALLNEAGLGWDCERGLGQARRGGEVCDVEGTPWWIEAKVGQRPNLLAALEQATEAGDGRPAIVVARVSGVGSRPPMDTVTMRLSDWVALLRRTR